MGKISLREKLQEKSQQIQELQKSMNKGTNDTITTESNIKQSKASRLREATRHQMQPQELEEENTYEEASEVEAESEYTKDAETYEEDTTDHKIQLPKLDVMKYIKPFLMKEKNMTIPFTLLYLFLLFLFSTSSLFPNYKIDTTNVYTQVLSGNTIKPAFVLNEEGYLTLDTNIEGIIENDITEETIAPLIPRKLNFDISLLLPALQSVGIITILLIVLSLLKVLNIYCSKFYYVMLSFMFVLCVSCSFFMHTNGIQKYNQTIESYFNVNTVRSNCLAYYANTASDMKSWLTSTLSDCGFYDTEGNYSTVVTIPQNYIIELLQKNPQLPKTVPKILQLDNLLYKARSIESQKVIYVFYKRINDLSLYDK